MTNNIRIVEPVITDCTGQLALSVTDLVDQTTPTRADVLVDLMVRGWVLSYVALYESLDQIQICYHKEIVVPKDEEKQFSLSI